MAGETVMRRYIALCLTALAAGLALTACGGEREAEGILEAASGIAPEAVAMTVDRREVPAWRYLYWLAAGCDYLSAAYGGGEIRWEDTVDGADLETYVREQAVQSAALYATVESWAEEHGCALTEEDRTAMRQEWTARTAQYGGEDAYLAELARLGLTRDQAEELSADAYLYRQLYERFRTEGSDLYPAERDLETFARQQGYLTVDHIWISAAAAGGDDACRAKAEEAFGKLNASADPAHDFAVLAATYSDETDRDQHPEGYTLRAGDGTLPAACEAAAADLEPGQWSGVIEAEDGFYLLLRKDTDLDAVAPDYFDALLQAAAESAGVSSTRACGDLDVSRFYQRLLQARSSLSSGGAA